MAALLTTARQPEQEKAVTNILLAIFFRTGLPLGAGFLLQGAGGELAQAGVFGMILCYYLVALLVETILSVRLIGSRGTIAEA